MPFTADQALTLRGRALTDEAFLNRLVTKGRTKETAAELGITLDKDEEADILSQRELLRNFSAAIRELARDFNPGGLDALSKPGVGSAGSNGGKYKGDSSLVGDLRGKPAMIKAAAARALAGRAQADKAGRSSSADEPARKSKGRRK